MCFFVITFPVTDTLHSHTAKNAHTQTQKQAEQRRRLVQKIAEHPDAFQRKEDQSNPVRFVREKKAAISGKVHKSGVNALVQQRLMVAVSQKVSWNVTVAAVSVPLWHHEVHYSHSKLECKLHVSMKL